MDDIKLHLTNRDVLFEIIKKLDYFESRLDAMEDGWVVIGRLEIQMINYISLISRIV